jgi:Cytochrome c7 and related cytochrome c/Seven Residue Repeat
MDVARWLAAIALGLAPMLGGMVLSPIGSAIASGVSSAASETAKSTGNSSGTASGNSGAKSSGSGAKSSGNSGGSSGVKAGVSVPQAKVTNPHGPLSIPCANCHSYSSWKPIRSNPEFNHDLTGYPLRGMHQNVGCSKCHTSLVFKNVSSQCSDCHADFHRRQFGSNCANCHSVKGWQVSLQAVQNHQNRFPLVGAHALLQCEDCHKNAAAGQFVGLSTACYSCHQQDFLTPVVDHVGLGLPTTCESCHTMDSWFNAKFDHLRYTGYALTGAHATLECTACHVNNVFKGTPAQCFACHSNDFNSSTNPPHAQMGLPRDCAICHSTSNWDNAKFDHTLYAKWPLTGKHAAVACAQCHTNNNFQSTSTDCYSCHQADFNTTTSPPHVSSGFPTDCSICHTTAGWNTSTFNHNATKFPLTGAHVSVNCAQCHVNNDYSGDLKVDCIGCHQTDFNNTNSPPHAASGFPTTCLTCHTTVAWTGAPFDHNKTKFPLTGSHISATCVSCHVNNNYTTLATNCVGCHQADYDNTNAPPHRAGKFPTTCETCHSTTDWTGGSFNHNTTRFPLTGAHASKAVTCAMCHVNNVFAGTPTDCYSCHTKEFTGTTKPNHIKSGFPTSCALCHTTAPNWTPSTFNHASVFPLTGAHATAACASCHINNNFKTVPTDCYSCHTKDYDGTTKPNHKNAGFPKDCVVCHSTTNWMGAVFDHNKTRFPLTGAHASKTVTCAMCHINNVFAGTHTDCFFCHTKEYNGTTKPNHKNAGFPTDCVVCHSTSSWSGAVFDHNKTMFPLTGGHKTVTCASCHVNNNYTTLPTNCYGCHQSDFKGAKSPQPHTGFPTDCTLCHTTAPNWTPSTFNHASVFPLTGAHATVACASCHINNNYTTVHTDCFSCHINDYNGTDNPNHKNAGFPTDCVVCHSTSSWSGAVFDHNKTMFPLTGGHKTVTCASCHVNNNYTTLPTNCYGCHQSDFKGAKSPQPHTGFPTDCTLCHTTAPNWTPSTFNHASVFPLTGAHATVACASCHINNNYTTVHTDCFSCHINDYNGTDNPNHKNAGFPTDCVVCHSTSSWSGAVFDHNKTMFPLTGGHKTVTCASCHVNNNYTTLPTNCYGCHQSDFKGAKSPQPHTGFPTDCTLCHTTAPNWTPSTFNHASVFPLTGAHATAACASCHINNNYTTVHTDCYSCHINDYNGTDNPNHAQANFPTDCQVCHSTSSWMGAVFDHNKTAFPLTGAHASKAVTCAMCHLNNNYTTLPTNCSGCHTAALATATPSHLGFPTTCEQCHTPTAWSTTTFVHSSVFRLVGAHTSLGCTACHTGSGNNDLYNAATCINCHQNDFNTATNPPHTNFPTDCTTCHGATPMTWGTANFNHSAAQTGFALTGAHTSVACATCHVNNNYSGGLPTACSGCHTAALAKATPSHLGFPNTCEQCHTPTAWSTTTFVHSSVYPLVGAHTSLGCTACHTGSGNNDLYNAATCINCHQNDFNTATNPPHTNFPTDCTTCHGATPMTWTTATFNHSAAQTGFALTGAHTSVACATCHVNNNYSGGLPTNCSGCHTAALAGATPSHLGFPTTCEQCHTPTAWSTTTFVHSSVFPLVGAHTSLGCTACHTGTGNNDLYNPATCINCHQNDFNSANSPPHTGFPTDCTTCHGAAPMLWTTATFNHTAAATGFALVGAHVNLGCAQCHKTPGMYTPGSVPTDCYSCHTTDFNGATSPQPHAGFPTDCTICHGAAPMLWTTASFNHSTFFPLVGIHATVACAQCHISNNYTTVATTCIGCHQANYTGTTNPNHKALGFPTTCDTCHTNTDWTVMGMNFNHAVYGLGWALQGTHATVPCASCHVGNNYNQSPALLTTCVPCHQTDFNNATTPQPHAGFPTDCSICHSITTWTSASFNHNNTSFPLVGYHATMQCVGCHTSASTYNGSLPTSCYSSGCHKADYDGTNNPNHAAAGFPYTCNTCHTMTDWTGATFNHNNTPFPLTGAHTSVACNKCHLNNVFAGTPTDCNSCHAADYSGTTNPNHATAGWPTTCATCHTTTAWLPGSLPTTYHTFFNLSHGKANGVCTTCHTNSSDYSVFTCTGCHGGNNAANFHHPNVNGYQYLSTACYSCHTKG